MRRLLVVSLVLTMGVLIFTIVVFAVATNPQDSYVYVNGPNKSNNYGSNNYLEASSYYNFAVTPPRCDTSQVIYLRWDLDQVKGVASTSGSNKTNLTLNAITTFQIGSGERLKLYKVTDDSWTESSITGNNAPSLGDLIEDIAAPTSPGLVVFSNVALADWINENSSYVGGGDVTAGNDIVSFAIQIEGCTNTAIVRFDSKEATSGTSPALNIFDPNSVTLSTFSANDSNQVNWPLIAGLIALGAAALVGLGYGVRRSKQS